MGIQVCAETVIPESDNLVRSAGFQPVILAFRQFGFTKQPGISWM